ncbi:hypothetical protein BN1325_450005 [Staphylococcus aureus]|nr:transposase for insertion sequence element IS431 [Staphylococcus aureus]CRI24625.1 hypothetical protein BN1323_400005 [Staphylococcus aureus]CRI24979.1 hypothetical protein BN1322_460005 [Staphylococcus aureus]CRI25287.1 hypothetical protein SAET23_470015 [Staphylococcus aureus]CRI29565.1 hypothetical protein BN1325_450005 [Staphylococcus aureus]
MNYFRYKQFNKDVITVAVGYYLRYALSGSVAKKKIVRNPIKLSILFHPPI